MRPLLVITVIISLFYESLQKAAGQTPVLSNAKNASSASFLDSIARKYELSKEQIGNYTAIDRSWFTGRRFDAFFSGDTVFHLPGGGIGAIIKYDDRRNCIYKFLLIFSPLDHQNTTCMDVYSVCDRDGEADYSVLGYKLINDSTFQTIESYIPANSNKVKSVEKHKWKISDDGRIYSLD